MKKIKIVCAFPLCGKTWAFRHQTELNFGRIADSDSVNYHWLHEKTVDGKEIVTRNPDFPRNYINNALELIDDGYDVVFLSTHEAVLAELNERGIDYYIVFPCREMRYEWLRRAHMREFNVFDPDLLFNERNFDYMIDSMRHFTSAHTDRQYVIASSGLYLPDVLTFFGFDSGQNVVKEPKKKDNGGLLV